MPREKFSDMFNDRLTMEGYMNCSECGRKQHDICELWYDKMGKKNLCHHCKRDRKRKDQPPFPSKKLPKTKLGDHLEKRVRKVLKDKGITGEDAEVTVRVVSIRDKSVNIQEGMQSYYKEDANPLPKSMKYKSKALFVFQKQDDVDVCFFGMHVQEYGDDAPPPNRGRVYVSYLDSVFFFKPKEYRTTIYKEMLCGYLDHCKANGYNYAHIWACPPAQGDDYIFHCHPQEQKVPKPKRLQDWYKDMLNMAKNHGCIHNWVDLQKYVKDNKIARARDIPYFEGDYWPGILEEKVKEINAESNETSDSAGGKKGSKKGSKKSGSKKSKGKAGGKKGKAVLAQGEEELADRCWEVLEKHKDVFFVAYLRTPDQINKSKAKEKIISEPDGDMVCELMDGRDGFLCMCRDDHREFSTLRRAKHSSLVLLYHLHNADTNDFNYTCNMCETPIGAMDYRWHCLDPVCAGDYDLCEKCHSNPAMKPADGELHRPEHKMEQLGFGVKETHGSTGGGSMSQQEQKRESVKRCIESLMHAYNCHDATCQLPSCSKMKNIIKHVEQCKVKPPGCNVCKQLVALYCFHAKHCRVDGCMVPHCKKIKLKLAHKQQDRAAASQMLQRRRMAAMAGQVVQPNGATTPADMGQQQATGAIPSQQTAIPGGSETMAKANQLHSILPQLEQTIQKFSQYIRQMQVGVHVHACAYVRVRV